MNGRNTKGQKAAHKSGLSRETAIYNELVCGFGNGYQPELDEAAFEALDIMLDFNEDDVFYCEASCLGYAAHVLTLENGPKELWIILDNDGLYVSPHGEEKQDVEDMGKRGKEVVRAIGKECPSFKGFANIPPNKPYKLLITVECALGGPDALCWAEMSSVFYHQQDASSIAAIIYPPIDKQSEVESLREGVQTGKAHSWAVELSNGRIIIGVGGGNGTCHMIDLSDSEHPWEIEASPFMVAACGGCLVPSMCRKCADALGETSLGELAIRISRGTSLSRKTLNPYPFKTVEWTRKILFDGGASGGTVSPQTRHITTRRYGSDAKEGDCLFLDSSCINADQVEPMFIDEIPRGQERYTVTPKDGKVLLISRNEKSFVFYTALAPTLIANSVFIVWLNPDIDARYLECWLEGSYAEQWLKTAGKMYTDPRNPEPILSKGTLASLPIPVFEQEIANQTVARKNAILQRIRELYNEIGMLETKESFAPASAMTSTID